MNWISKKSFLVWAAKHDWLKFNDQDTPNGYQESFLTPPGEVFFILYDAEDNVKQVAKLFPPMAMAAPTRLPGVGFLGGQQFRS